MAVAALAHISRPALIKLEGRDERETLGAMSWPAGACTLLASSGQGVPWSRVEGERMPRGRVSRLPLQAQPRMPVQRDCFLRLAAES